MTSESRPAQAPAAAGLNHRKVADLVAEHIERLVVDSVLRVGQALPSERRLMDRLGCSRSALREGLRILRGRGIIRTEHGRGSFVAATSPARDAGPLLHLFASQPRTLFDLLEVRVLLEAEAARLAASRATTADMVLIRRHFEAWQAAQALRTQPGEPPLEAAEQARRDHAFHRAIAEAAHNPVLVHTLEFLSELMLGSVYASVSHLYSRPLYKQQIDRQHLRIFRAIEQRKPDAAWRAAREHVLSVRDNLLEVESEQERITRATMRLRGWG
ncbi:transcriptional regulator GlcC [Corticibacter populi]|uniref:Transcriptional regulator GlcC n=1 Tax=Corticibacter populi TaxID=1550736 RepID=A0A3M6QV54_9BURK|nr:transcriptional regulator GlcC [Corticibacter populi]RMX06888.1 transcriptional regulator GlcC [Corticibacter populi]